MAQNSLKQFSLRLIKNHNILKEREAKYATAAPLNLLNQIGDYEQAITLTEQAIAEDIPLDALQAAFAGLNLEVDTVIFIPQEPPRKPFTGQNPYRGLRKFTESEAEFFFGRNAAIQNLLSLIQNLLQTETNLQARNLIAVLGPSGSGKSSLVRAGLIPALQNGRIEGSEAWPIRVMLPGPHPLDALAAQFVALTERGLPALRADLDRNERSLQLLVTEALTYHNEEAYFVLVIDQFEELFTLCRDEVERQAFLDQLLYSVLLTRGRAVIILTMRADFYSKVAAYPGLAQLITANQLLVSPLSEKELREVILLPAEAVGLELEKALVEVLIKDTVKAPAALPLLQFALFELFQRRDGNLLTLDSYHQIGGVEGALGHRADQVMSSLTPDQQQIARRIFMRLIQPGEGTQDTRRRARKNELWPDQAQAESVENVVQLLADARLVTTDRDHATGEEQVDVAHEALVQGWSQLRSWLDENRAALRTHRRLTEATEEWKRNERDESYLYRGARLAEAEEWAETNAGHLNTMEREFLEASLTAARAVERAKETARRRRNLLVLGLGIVSIAVACFMTGLAGLAVRFALVSEARAIAAQARSVLDDNPPLAVRLALTAQNIAETDEAERVIADALFIYPPLPVATITDHSIPIQFLKWSPDGSRLISGGGGVLGVLGFEYGGWNFTDNQSIDFPGLRRGFAVNPDGSKVALNSPGSRQLLIWDTITNQLDATLKGHSSYINTSTWSPNGKLLASGLWSGQVILWDMTTGKQAKIFEDHTDWVISLAFSPDSKRLAARSLDGIVIIWNIETGQIISTLKGKPGYFTLGWSPDGAWLTDRDTSLIRASTMWNVDTGQEFIAPGNFSISGLDAWSPNKKHVILSLSGKNVVWDMTRDQMVSELLDGTYQAIWSPQGTRLALYDSGDAEITVWDVDKDEAIVTLKNNLSRISTVSWSPDGTELASGHVDGRVVVWDVNSNQVVSKFLGHSMAITALAWSPDGAKLASGSEDAMVEIWDLTGNRLPVIEFEGGSVDARSPDDTHLALRSDEDSVLLWDVKQGKSVAVVESQSKIVFNPDGTLLAARPGDHTIDIWDVHRGEKVSTLAGHDNEITVLSWSPDSKLLASGGADNQVILWKAAQGQAVTRLNEHTDVITALVWSSDGRQLASGSKDKAVFVWNTVSRQLSGPFLGHVNEISELTWNSDGTRLWSSSSADSVDFVWDVASGQPVVTASGLGSHFTDNGSHLVSNAYRTGDTIAVLDPVSGRLVTTIRGGRILAWSPGGEYIATESNDNIVTLWNLVDNRPIGTSEDIASVLAWHPTGTQLAFRSQRNLIEILDIEHDEVIQTLEGHQSEIDEIIWSPDGESLASRTINNEVKIWNVDKGSPLITKDGLLNIVWSPDGSQLVSGAVDNTILLWDADGEEMTLAGHTEPVTAIAWSPNGKWAASGGQDKTVILWDTVTGEKMATFNDHDAPISDLSWNPDSKQLAIGFDDGSIIVWDVQRNESILTLEEAYGQAGEMAWSQDGTYLIASIGQKVTSWEIATGQPFKSFQGISQATNDHVAYNSSGSMLAIVLGEKLTIIWDAATGEPSIPLDGQDPYSNRPEVEQAALFTEERVVLWDLVKNKAIAEFEGYTDKDKIQWGRWSPDGKYLAAVSEEGRVFIWNVNQRQLVTSFKEYSDDSFYHLSWNPKGNLLALESHPGKVDIWDVDKNEIVATYPGNHANHFGFQAWSPDGAQLVWQDSDHSFVVWYPDSEEFLSIEREGISHLFWISDGAQLLITWEQPDRGVEILDKRFTQPPCQWISHNLSFQEWQQYIPWYLLPYRNACPDQPLPPLNYPDLITYIVS